jgi:beta-galactosidase
MKILTASVGCFSLSCLALAMAAPSTRESFDAGWKFARFGTMPDGSHLDEPGAVTPPVRASSEEAGHPAAHAIDEDPETRWCASGEADGQWLTLDLGRAVRISGLRVVWEKPSSNHFSLAVSDDARDWREVVAPREPGALETRLAVAAGGRFVRLTADGSPGSWASVRTFEVLDEAGRPLRPLPPPTEIRPASPERPGFNDSSWRVLDLPHDWAIEGPFRMEIENETGKLPWVGIGWYRKSFDVPASAAGTRHYLDLDGAMAQPKVYVNGSLASEWKYGYNSFRVDLTPHLRPGARNTIAIRLENLPSSSRWYPGAGIYRHVWWVTAPSTHIGHWGVAVTTPEVADEQASVEVVTTLENHASTVAPMEVSQEIIDASGKVVAQGTEPVRFDRAGTQVKQRLLLPKPRRWDINDPHLYTLRTSLAAVGGDAVADRAETRFGVRTIEWHPRQGFLLNGRKVVLQGVCNHHDLGPLGSAVHTRAIERQIELLKEMGCNSIRTSHNPPAPELLELCDRMGILVIDELFDIWKLRKADKVNGYNIFWDEWHARDVRNFILRDRNHPCVIAWSTGNELPELSQPAAHGVSARLRDLMKELDTTRPVTAGSNFPAAAWNGFQKTVDVFGLNYHLEAYGKVDEALPQTAIYASETSSTVSTRGEYFFPVDWNKAKGFYNFQVSSYELYAPGWANRPDLQFAALDKHPRYAGEYVWTGFDYIGEPTPYNLDTTNALNFGNAEERAAAMAELQRLGNRAPSRSSYFGILDLCGFPKDRFYLYQSRWRPDLPVAHLLPHWNWPERMGQVTPVHAFTNGDEAELFLNGKSLGVRHAAEPRSGRLTWDDVGYQPGRLELVVRRAGRPWAKAVRETTGPAKALGLCADRTRLAADGCDLSYLTIRVLDAQGREVPRTRIPVEVTLRGAAVIAGIGNGDPTDHTPMKPADPARARITAFNGLAQVIVRSKRGASGPAVVEVAAEGLAGASVTVQLAP